MSNFELAVLFCILFGVATLVSFAALAGKIKFSLRTIFIIVTTSSIGFALFSALGDEMFGLISIVLMLGLPLANILIVAVLFVSVVNSAGPYQAIRIGWLTPLVGMAFIDCGRIAFGGNNAFSAGFLVYYPMVYITAWIAGAICERTYFTGQSRRPLRGTYRQTVRSRGQSVHFDSDEQSTSRNTPKPKANVPSPFSKSVAHPLDDEPNVYEIE